MRALAKGQRYVPRASTRIGTHTPAFTCPLMLKKHHPRHIQRQSTVGGIGGGASGAPDSRGLHPKVYCLVSQGHRPDARKLLCLANIL